MSNEMSFQGKPSKLHLMILSLVTGALGLIVPVISVGSQHDEYSLLGLLQAGFGVGDAYFSDSVRQTMMISGIIICLFAFSALAVCERAAKGGSYLSIVVQIPMVSICVYLLFVFYETNANGWNAEVTIFAWILFVLAVAIAVVHKRVMNETEK